MKQVSKASQLNKSVKQVSLASQVKQVGLASQVSNLPKSSQESEIKKVLVKQVQVKQVKSSKFKLSNLNQASEVMLDRDTAPRKRPSTRLSGKTRSQRSSQPSRNAFQHLKPDGYAKEPSRRGCSLLVAGVGDGIGFLARKNY